MPRTPGRYPALLLRSKNELAKRIAGKNISRQDALQLIHDVLANFDSYWYDSKSSQPDKGKYVRSCAGSPLGRLLKLIDKRILARYDYMLPPFIFGGVSRKNHILAAQSLLGHRKKRALLGLDISSFFEQIHQERVYNFFFLKCRCSPKAAEILAKLCCVPSGPKGSGSPNIILARGFATSSRLSVWCNLDTFLKINWHVKRKLKNYDPRLAIFIDDIGITASQIDHEKLKEIAEDARRMFLSLDPSQPLPLNEKKTKIIAHDVGMEHLGLGLGRNKVHPGAKILRQVQIIRQQLKSPLPKPERRRLVIRRKSYMAYIRQIEKTNKKATHNPPHLEF